MIGLLKVGNRSLYLYDAAMKECKQSAPLCILDFYVHESRQRKGFGHQLFDFMINVTRRLSPSLIGGCELGGLQREGAEVAKVAIDRPSDSLLCFMTKHYGLTSPIWQSTNYVVYPPFFAGHPPQPTSCRIFRTKLALRWERGGGGGGRPARCILPPPVRLRYAPAGERLCSSWGRR